MTVFLTQYMEIGLNNNQNTGLKANNPNYLR
jgi:hypothetical protein